MTDQRALKDLIEFFVYFNYGELVETLKESPENQPKTQVVVNKLAEISIRTLKLLMLVKFNKIFYNSRSILDLLDYYFYADQRCEYSKDFLGKVCEELCFRGRLTQSYDIECAIDMIYGVVRCPIRFPCKPDNYDAMIEFLNSRLKYFIYQSPMPDYLKSEIKDGYAKLIFDNKYSLKFTFSMELQNEIPEFTELVFLCKGYHTKDCTKYEKHNFATISPQIEFGVLNHIRPSNRGNLAKQKKKRIATNLTSMWECLDKCMLLFDFLRIASEAHKLASVNVDDYDQLKLIFVRYIENRDTSLKHSLEIALWDNYLFNIELDLESNAIRSYIQTKKFYLESIRMNGVKFEHALDKVKRVLIEEIFHELKKQLHGGSVVDYNNTIAYKYNGLYIVVGKWDGELYVVDHPELNELVRGRWYDDKYEIGESNISALNEHVYSNHMKNYLFIEDW